MATPVLGSAVVAVSAPLQQLQKDLGVARTMTDKQTGGINAKLGATGARMTRTLTPAAAGIGLAGRQAFNEWDGGLDAIRAGTGATGAALEDLGDSMEKVAGRVAIPMSEVGSILADLNTGLGLTGKPLEDLTQQVAELQEIGQQVAPETVSRAFGDWAIEADNMGGSLDALFRLSQASGISVDDLASRMTDFGAPLRALGFGFEESAALIAKWQKEGVNTEAVLAGMKVGLGKMAKAGEQPKETLQRLITEIEGVGTEGEAMAIAAEAFGTRAGPDMAMAIREGRFELDDYLAVVSDGEETIHTAAEGTRSMSDRFAMLKNRVFAVVGPFGEMGMAVGGLGAGLGPAITGISKVGPALMGVMTTAAPLMPWLLALAAAFLIGKLIYDHWDEIKEFLGKAIGWIIDKGKDLIAFLPNLVPPFLIGKLIFEHFDEIVDFFRKLPGRLLSAGGAMFDFVWEAFKGAVNAVIDAWNGLEFEIPGFKMGPVKFGGFVLGVPDIPSLDVGGNIGSDGLVFAHAGEQVLPVAEVDRLDSDGFSTDVGAERPLVANLYLDGRQILRAVVDAGADRRARGGQTPW